MSHFRCYVMSRLVSIVLPQIAVNSIFCSTTVRYRLLADYSDASACICLSVLALCFTELNSEIILHEYIHDKSESIVHFNLFYYFTTLHHGISAVCLKHFPNFNLHS